MKLSLIVSCLVATSAFKLNVQPKAQLAKASAALTTAAVTFHAEAAHAKSVLGVNGALDFGPRVCIGSIARDAARACTF